jgi:Tfp pilus assembly protein PilV
MLRKQVKMKVRSKKGFVLPEVMLAAAIAAFAVCGILLMYVTAMDLIRTSKNDSIAISAAQGLIEEIRNTPFPKIALTPGEDEQGFSGLTFTVAGIASSSGLVSVDDTDPELLLVTVSVRWRPAGRAVDSTVGLVTQVANR